MGSANDKMAFSSPRAAQAHKIIHAMRHGITEMNVYLARHPYSYSNYRDPLMYDTVLTREGMAGAERAAGHVERLQPPPEVVVVSPMTRTLQTYELAWGTCPAPTVIEALARERVWLASDIGTEPHILREKFSNTRFSFDHLPQIWWHSGGSTDPKHVILEPEDVFNERVNALKAALLRRPERVMGLVSHWGVLSELTGHDFENCELVTFGMDETGEMHVLQARRHGMSTAKYYTELEEKWVTPIES